MVTLLIIFGLFSGCLLSVLVGLVGRTRNIGFGLSFLLSLFFTPLIGLLITLLSNEKAVQPNGNNSWGCIATTAAFFTALMIASIIMLLAIV